MRHIRPQELLVLDRRIIRPGLFIPGLAPVPKIIGAAREVNPGSQSWTSPGTYYWSVPLFNNLYITVKGAGAGGSGAGWATSDFYEIYNYYGDGQWVLGRGATYQGGVGGGGGYGRFTVPSIVDMIAYGGTGGPAGSRVDHVGQNASVMSHGAHGQGYNGNSANYLGNGIAGGSYGYAYTSIPPWYPPPSTHWPPYPGSWYGTIYGGSGGNGGRCDSHYTLGQIAKDTQVTIVVQAGGAAGWQVTNSGGAYPVAGGAASVSVSWD